MNTSQPEAVAHIPEADSFDFQRSLETVKQAVFYHKMLIAVTMVLTLAIVVVYMVAFPANYEAQVVLIADSDEDMDTEDFYRHWNIFRGDSLNDEGQMMISSLIVGKVVDELDLKYVDVYHSFMNHLGYLWVESLIGKAYRKVKSWIFPPDTRFVLSPEELERGKTILSFKDGIALAAVPDTNVGALVARGPSPRIADIANTMVDLFLEERKNRMRAEADKAYKALKIEVDKALVKLDGIENELEEHYEENNMMMAFEKDKLQVTTWIQLKASIVEDEANLAHIVAKLEEVNRQLETQEKDTVSSRVLIKNSSRVTLRNQIVQLQIALEQARIRYNEGSPEIEEIQDQIAAIGALWSAEEESEEASATRLVNETYQSLQILKSSLMSDLKGVTATLRVKKESDRKIEERLKALPSKLHSTQKLEREHRLLENRYVGLSEKLTMAAVSMAAISSAPAALQVVDYAQYPEKPYWPKAKYLVLGALVFGALMGIAIAIVLDFIYGRVSRYRLSTGSTPADIYAILPRDRKYLAGLYKLVVPDAEMKTEQVVSR